MLMIFLYSEDDEETTTNLVNDVTTLCDKGGFKLMKWVSNSRSVLSSIPPETRAKELQSLSLSLDELPSGRALGLYWNIQEDVISVQTKIETIEKIKPTRRTLLSVVSSVFDPLGLVSPVTLNAKIILRDLVNEPWDKEISDPQLQQWEKWLSSLNKLEQFVVPRCLKPLLSSKIALTQLHYFSDASNKGYGIVVYIRFLYESGEIHSQLVLSRARVSPIKQVTIPRMELAAATTAVKMNKKLREELTINVNSTFYWTDSLTVLKYIANERTRFKTYVANRLSIIREGSNVKEWRFVSTRDNPADCVSRGMTAEELLQADWWMTGPSFLSSEDVEFQQGYSDLQIKDDDPEVKVHIEAQCCQVELTENPLHNLMKKCSTWNKLKRITGWLLRYLENLKHHALLRKQNKDIPTQARKAKGIYLWLSQNILKRAEKCLYLETQQRYFGEEIKIVKQGKDDFKGNSSVRNLNPVMKNGLLTVGGRQQDLQSLVIIPKNSPLSPLLIKAAHIMVGHMGRNAILANLRQKFWIIGANSLIRNIMSKCTLCRKYRAQALEQKMGNLPSDRLTPCAPPFSKVGVDYFGPFIVKRGRASVKRYGVIFTCLTSRAVHLEIAHSLDTDSCINTIRRFISRRGPVETIRSDNGTNLVGACRELKEEIKRWNEATFNNALQQQNITWCFNTPTASHQGGIWERLIRSVRKILYAVLHEGHMRLDDESLQTYMCEVESILNNRPITLVSPDSNDLEVLTPNHLLLQRSTALLPPGVFDKTDSYARQRWKQVQYLTNVFWERWVREYLPMLQECQKWQRKKRNLQENDIVLVMDNSPRNAWTLGRVMETHKDNKGLVRSAAIKTPSTVLQRPVQKLSLVYSPEHMESE